MYFTFYVCSYIVLYFIYRMTVLDKRLQVKRSIITRESFKIFKENYVLLAYFPKLGKLQFCKALIKDKVYVLEYEYTCYIDVIAIEDSYAFDYISLECIIKYCDGKEWHDFPYYLFAQALSKIPKYAKYYKRVIINKLPDQTEENNSG
jgi:hypothetical protein